jgi:hypothetical protein
VSFTRHFHIFLSFSGMSQEQLGSLFQDFAASKLSITRTRGGYGLGMHQCDTAFLFKAE